LQVTRTLLERFSQSLEWTVNVYEGSLSTSRDIYLELDSSGMREEDVTAIRGICNFGATQFEEKAFFVHLQVSEQLLAERRSLPSQASWTDIYGSV
jgi:hypothetical protein